MSRGRILTAAIAAMLVVPSLTGAADYQEGRSRSCTGTNVCRLDFAGPGAGLRLRLEHVTCKLGHYNELSRPVEFFDDNNALYLPMFFARTRNGYVSVGNARVAFFTGGPNMRITAFLGDLIRSELACTIKGQSF